MHPLAGQGVNQGFGDVTKLTEVLSKAVYDGSDLGKCFHLSILCFVCVFALGCKSTAMVMVGRSVHLTTLFLGKLVQAVNQYFVHILSLVTDNNPSSMIQLKGGE